MGQRLPSWTRVVLYIGLRRLFRLSASREGIMAGECGGRCIVGGGWSGGFSSRVLPEVWRFARFSARMTCLGRLTQNRRSYGGRCGCRFIHMADDNTRRCSTVAASSTVAS
ncbi:hypothetical protein PIB30_077183 [Stylosanthes scabra]|uniref:Secreted protein n=1 Tax=Stylosanthes scabra TaxID=79078 RepID=A0ABU6UPW3_9FABA|nr:hypothetical protein [Stylosanthes scabra]